MGRRETRDDLTARWMSSPRLTNVVLVSLFHMFYEFDGCRAISLDFARHDQPNFSSVSLYKPTPSRQIYKKLASCLLLQSFLLIQLFRLFVSSSAGWLMSFNCFSFSPESQRWITKVRGQICLNLQKHLQLYLHLNLRLIMVSIFLPYILRDLFHFIFALESRLIHFSWNTWIQQVLLSSIPRYLAHDCD